MKRWTESALNVQRKKEVIIKSFSSFEPHQTRQTRGGLGRSGSE